VNPQVPEQTAERRQYFRIKHSLLMNFQPIEENEEFDASANVKDESPDSFHILKKIYHLKQKNLQLLEKSSSDDNLTTLHLKQQNKEFESLTELITSHLDIDYKELLQVDLSGGGLRFISDKALQLEQALKMDIVLLPEFCNIVAYGLIVDCTKTNNNNYQVAVSFSQISEPDRDAIIRHVFEAESKHLRNQKEKSAN